MFSVKVDSEEHVFWLDSGLFSAAFMIPGKERNPRNIERVLSSAQKKMEEGGHPGYHESESGFLAWKN